MEKKNYAVLLLFGKERFCKWRRLAPLFASNPRLCVFRYDAKQSWAAGFTLPSGLETNYRIRNLKPLDSLNSYSG